MTTINVDFVDDFLAHYGKKGMKWGVRRAVKRAEKGPDRFGNRNNDIAQLRVDRMKRVATGKATTTEMLRSALFEMPAVYLVAGGGPKGGAQLTLGRQKKFQSRVLAGRNNVSDMLNRLGGVDVRELNFDPDK